MACSIERQKSIVEAAKIEAERLQDLLDQGYTTDELNDIQDIEVALKDMQAIANQDVEQVKKIKDPGVAVSDSALLELNMNNPRFDNKPVYVVSGRRYEDGRVEYQVRYRNGNKDYQAKAARMTADQVDPSEIARYGSEPGVEANLKYHKHLDDKIWKDQKAALELYDHLAGFDSATDEEHKKYLRGVLEEITDPQAKILNKFKVYINEEAEKNGGAAVIHNNSDGNKIILDATRGGIVNGEMSAAEAYVHEMVHMSVEFARQYNRGPIVDAINQLNHLYEKAAKEIKISDLVVNGDKKAAERLWNYMFNNESGKGLAEFIAYGMTNQNLRARLAKIEVKDATSKMGTTISDKILDVLVNMWESLKKLVTGMSNEEMKADDKLGQLVAHLWEHNNRSVEQSGLYANIKDAAEKVRSVVDENLVKVGKKVVDLIAEGTERVIEANKENVLGKSLNVVSTLAKVVNPLAGRTAQLALNKTARDLEKHSEDGVLGSWLFKQEGSMQTVLNYIKSDDNQKTRIEKLGLLSSNIDRHRQELIARVGGDLHKALKGVSSKELESMTNVMLDLDMRVLYAKYSNEQVAELLKSDTKTKALIAVEAAKLRKMVADDGVYNYYVSQTKGLGSYLATHVSGSSVNRSARHIKDMKGTGYAERVLADKLIKANEAEVVKSIDRLATLEGLLATDRSEKDTVARVLETHPEAVDKIVTYHNAHAALDYAYKSSHAVYVHTVKGEVKDLKAGWIDVMVAGDSESDIQAMKKKNYKYKGPAAAKGMGVYTTSVSGFDTFDKGAAAKINPGKELFNLTTASAVTLDDKAEGLTVGAKVTSTYIEKMEEEIKKQMAGIKMPVMDGMTRELSGDKVTGFGVSVDKQVYKDATKQDRKIHAVLAKMLGEVEEKQEAAEINRVVFKEVLLDMEANYKRGEVYGKNEREYIEIGPNAKNQTKTAEAYAKDVWNNLPADIKDMIKRREKGKRYIAVRRDMAADYFGRRAPSVLNMKLPMSNTTIEEYMRDKDWDAAVNGLKLAGDIWQEAVKDMKIDAVIKSPAVLWANIKSNIYLQSALGQTPWGAVAGQIKMFKATKEYLKLERRKIDLEMLVRAKKATLVEKAELNRVRGLMKDSPVYDTMQAGLYTGISDEMNTAGLTSNTRLEDMLQKYTGKLPKVVRTIGSTIYMTRDTWMYKALMQVMQYSDFVMRSSRYLYLTEKGYPKATALKMVTDEGVNYNRDLGPELSWVKKMGFWWFFNYFLGATKMLASKLPTRPSALLLMEMSGVTNPMDAAIWNKNFGYTTFGPMDLMLKEAPSHIMNPALLKATGVL